jgi:hypothetical protein
MNPGSDVGLGGAQLSLGENAFDAAVPVPIAPFVPALSPVQGSMSKVQRAAWRIQTLEQARRLSALPEQIIEHFLIVGGFRLLLGRNNA